MDASGKELGFHLGAGGVTGNREPAEQAGGACLHAGEIGIKDFPRLFGQADFLMNQIIGSAGENKLGDDFRVQRGRLDIHIRKSKA